MDPTVCRMCGERKLTLPEQQAYGVCVDCFHLPGFFKLPPNTRLLKPCSECGGREHIRALAFERGAVDGGWGYAAPMAVAFRQSVRRGGFIASEPKAASVAPADVLAPVGFLELLICRACGLVTWHALGPEKIPIGPEYGTELVRADDDGGPYR